MSVTCSYSLLPTWWRAALDLYRLECRNGASATRFSTSRVGLSLSPEGTEGMGKVAGKKKNRDDISYADTPFPSKILHVSKLAKTYSQRYGGQRRWNRNKDENDRLVLAQCT
jgi:hypothetical protein